MKNKGLASKYNSAIRSQSEKCKCGRYCYISKKRGFAICSWCGRKVMSKREWFKLNLRKAMENLKIKEELERGI